MSTINIFSKSSRRLLQCRFLSISPKSQSPWTSDNIVKSPFKDVEIPNITVPEKIWQNIDKWADKTALVCGITNRSYTYHQLYKYSHNFAANLRSKFGIRDGDVICIMMPNSPEYGVTVLGALQAGAEVTTINPIYTAHEVGRQLILSNPKVIIGVPETIKAIREAYKLIKKDIPIIAVTSTDENLPPKTIAYAELALNDVDHTILRNVTKKPEDIALLPYSSGTTGLPKGVELDNRNIISNLVQLDADEIKHYSDTTSSSQDSTLGILPFFHIYGLVVVLLHKLSVGQKVVTLPRFQPATFLHAMKEHKINLLLAAPPIISFCGSHKDVTKDHLEHAKVITSGAAPLANHEVIRLLERSSPELKFIQLYGLTETSPVATSMIPGEDDYSSSGYALSNTELKIVDSEMRNLKANEVGELLIRGPQVMRGYRNNPEATSAAIAEDGWFKSGDLAKIDKKGFIVIADRLKELIKVKGYQVPPAELESVLKEHPSILDVAVVGIPDDKQGEAPKAFVVLKEGHKLKTEEVTKFVEERVAPYKKVKEVMFIEAIPKNASGKILRRVLKEQYC